jgi:hypothetical protein
MAKPPGKCDVTRKLKRTDINGLDFDALLYMRSLRAVMNLVGQNL